MGMTLEKRIRDLEKDSHLVGLELVLTKARIEHLNKEVELLKTERATVKWVCEQLQIKFGKEVIKVDLLELNMTTREV